MIVSRFSRLLSKTVNLRVLTSAKLIVRRPFSTTVLKADKKKKDVEEIKENEAVEGDELEYEYKIDDTEKVTYKIKNPDTASNDLPFMMISYPPGTDGFTSEQLNEVLELDPKVLEILQHFYEVKKGEKFTLDQCKAICWQFGCELVDEDTYNAQQAVRPPIITIMGHVDHGKTTLLDSYRRSNLTEGEVGGITQKIGGFIVDTPYGKVSFVDTPGHALFANMRRTGAQCTDIIVLVISAIEGVQSQTHEVLRIIEETNIPVIVAINKIDSNKADPESVEESLWNMGIEVEPMGGNVPVVHVSAVNQINTTLLLELIIFEAERLGIKSNINKSAQAYVIEGKQVEAKNCCIILRQGRLKRGDFLLSGSSYCKVLRILDDNGKVLEEATAGMAVQVLGFKNLPQTNERLLSVPNERLVKEFMKLREYFNTLEENKTLSTTQIEGTKIKFSNRKERRKFHSGKKEVIEKIYADKLEKMQETKKALVEKGKDTEAIDYLIEDHLKTIERFKSGDKKGMKIMIKANDLGTLDTMVTHALNIKDSSGFRNFEIVKADIGPLTEADLIESLEFESKIYTMDVGFSGEIEDIIKEEGIDVRTFKIIYQFLEDLKMLNDSLNETYGNVNILGRASIKEFFDVKLNQNKTIRAYGLTIESGVINKNTKLRLVRNRKVIYDNMKLAGLRSFKKEVTEVKAGNECGLSFVETYDIIKGDQVECYEDKKDY